MNVFPAKKPGPTRAALIASLVLGLVFAGASFAQEGEESYDEMAPVLILTIDDADLLVGETSRVSLKGRFADGAEVELTADEGAEFLSSHPEVATVAADGAVVATGPGKTLLGGFYLGLAGKLEIEVRDPEDLDGDGILDEVELANGLDPTDPSDPARDLDADRLTNARELQLGTSPQLADTDGDGVDDGTEIADQRNPLGPDPYRLNATCMVSVLNRTAPVRPGGYWNLSNVPSNQGLVRFRATCVDGGVSRFGQSDWVLLPSGGPYEAPEISFVDLLPIPTRLGLSAPVETLTSVGQQVQLTATATLPDGTSEIVTPAAAGTGYRSSNPALASVDAEGRVTAHASGTVFISALHQGSLALLRFLVVVSGDSDGDGIPDDVELANGLDPNDPIDAAIDGDGDGLATLAELNAGLDPSDPDSDDDTLLDGREVNQTGTDPRVADTDGDRVRDGLEIPRPAIRWIPSRFGWRRSSPSSRWCRTRSPSSTTPCSARAPARCR